MNWKEEYNGKPVNLIIIGEGQGAVLYRNTSEKDDGLALIFIYSYHGEYDEGWVIQLDKNGTELRRFNAKFISQIDWLR